MRVRGKRGQTASQRAKVRMREWRREVKKNIFDLPSCTDPYSLPLGFLHPTPPLLLCVCCCCCHLQFKYKVSATVHLSLRGNRPPQSQSPLLRRPGRSINALVVTGKHDGGRVLFTRETQNFLFGKIVSAHRCIWMVYYFCNSIVGRLRETAMMAAADTVGTAAEGERIMYAETWNGEK